MQLMAIRLAEFSELRSLFYDGLTDARHWDTFLDQTCKRLDCNKAALSFHDTQNMRATVGVSVGMSGREMQEFESYYWSRNPTVAERTAITLGVGSWHSVFNPFDRREYLESEYYRDYCLPHGIIYAALAS